MLVEDTIRYYHHYFHTLDVGSYPLPDIIESEMFLFLAIIAQVGCDIHNSLANSWSMIKQFLAPFAGPAVKFEKVILRYLIPTLLKQ